MHTLPLPEVTDNNQKTKIGNVNSHLASAQIAPRASNFDHRVSALAPHLTPQRLQFLLRVAPAALASQRDFQIPACVTIAQAILESGTAAGWGSSVLFRAGNAGIRCQVSGARCQASGKIRTHRLTPGTWRLIPGSGLRSGWDLKPPRWIRSIVDIPQTPATPPSLSSWYRSTALTIRVP